MSIAWPTLRALVLEALVCVATVAVAVWLWNPVVTALAMVVVATRQHALFILYHDAVHGLIAKPLRLNDLVINAFAGVPMLLPVHVYRSLHMVHHRTLGTRRDPERVLLYVGQDWDYRPLPARRLLRQLVFDTLLVNQLKTVVAYARELYGPNPVLDLPRSRWWPELVGLNAVFWGGALAFAWVEPTLALRAAVVWLVPLVTLTQGIQKVRSFAEHAALDAHELSYSWQPGLLGRLVLWPYNIQYHREHHERPSVPWYRLPEAFPEREARPGRTLPALLWDGTL
ncbi:MAG: fatty acid desaturase family protein [Alphaproteobacteria bacterium]|nr:fatty acid desaturase family protein [Alphaproteobacteria bacterium]